MLLQIIKTTDEQNIGRVIDIPGVEDLGILSLGQIQSIASGFNGGQFKPDRVIRSGSRVRLVGSNYSVTLEKIDG